MPFTKSDIGKAVHSKVYGDGIIEIFAPGKHNKLISVLFNGDKWDSSRTIQTYNQHGVLLESESRLWQNKQTLFLK